ncbi:MAG: hypothetical protein N4A47_07170 [Clostridia bacterium]|jgi:hypothetical protein|nr:hypothetical protein [Clostridia bacterium]
MVNILISIPIIAFLSQLLFSAYENNTKAFIKNYTISILDFIFIPFNVYAYNAIYWGNYRLTIGLLILSSLGSLYTHYNWSKEPDRHKHIVKSYKRLHISGYIHAIFCIVEMLIIGMLVLSYRVDRILEYKIAGVILIIYFLFSIVSSYYVHNRKIYMEDLLRGVLGGIIIGLTLIIRGIVF